MATSELACTYAALILHDDGLEITAENLNTILKAANVSVEPYWPSLYAKLFAKKSVGDLITNVGAAGGCVQATGQLLPAFHGHEPSRRPAVQPLLAQSLQLPLLVLPLLPLLPKRRRRRRRRARCVRCGGWRGNGSL
jgi:ribosomal protein L12E/L44/L45/RPP1/RPP2